MDDWAKRTSWVVIVCFVSGFLSQHVWFLFWGIPQLGQFSILEPSVFIFGMFAVLQAFLFLLTLNSFHKAPPLKEAIEHHTRLHPGERGKRKFVFVLVRFLINFSAYNLKYFMFIWVLEFALTGYRLRQTIWMFSVQVFGMLLGLTLSKLRQAGKISNEPDIFYESFEEVISSQESDKNHIKRLFPLVFMSVFFSALWYPNISASAGGGYWGKAVIYMKPNHDVRLPSGHLVDGQLLDVIFWGEKDIVIKEHPNSTDHLTLIHSADVARAYVGLKVEQINQNWTK